MIDTIRPVENKDLPAVLAIHNDAVLNTTAIWSVHPVDLANRQAVLQDRQGKGYAFLGAFEGDDLLGYATFGDFRPHDGYFRTVEHSIYVHPGHHRRGVARALMPPLIEAARAIGKHAMVGGIDAANAGSVALHEAFGFVRVGLLPQVGFKFGHYLDLLFMQKILDEEASPPLSTWAIVFTSLGPATPSPPGGEGGGAGQGPGPASQAEVASGGAKAPD